MPCTCARALREHPAAWRRARRAAACANPLQLLSYKAPPPRRYEQRWGSPSPLLPSPGSLWLPCVLQLWQQLTSGSTLSIWCSLSFAAGSWLWLLRYTVRSRQSTTMEKNKKNPHVTGRASLCITQESGTPSTVGPALVFLAGQKKPPCPKEYHPSATRCKARSLSAPRAVLLPFGTCLCILLHFSIATTQIPAWLATSQERGVQSVPHAPLSESC